MSSVRILVLRTAGINCDEEVMHCWNLAGASPKLMHINRLIEEPAILDDFHLVTIPGGFSYGDDIAAGTVLAQRVLHDLMEPMLRLVERGGGILGICNGFQVLVKTGLLPQGGNRQSQVTVTYNHSAKFEARWVRLEVATDRCPFLTPGTHIELPVEHAEGRVVVSNKDAAQALEGRGHIALRYVDDHGRSDRYPSNPNGSDLGIAGLCDATGRIFGLMPHPDRCFDRTHHPQWTRRTDDSPPDGLSLFRSAVAHWK